MTFFFREKNFGFSELGRLWGNSALGIWNKGLWALDKEVPVNSQFTGHSFQSEKLTGLPVFVGIFHTLA